MKKILIVCTTDSMIWNFLIPHIDELKKRGYHIECACSVTGEFYDNLQNKYGIIMNRIDFQRSPFKTDNIHAYKTLKALIRDKNFDTIFCHEPVGGALARIAGHRCGCRVIYMAHGFHFYKGAPKKNWILFYSAERFLARYTDLLITINEEDYHASLKFKAGCKKKINGIGVDTYKFTQNSEYKNYLRDLYNINDDATVVLSVGELSRRKNHKVIIQAIANLNNKNIYYFIAGEGEKRDELQEMIKENGLEDNIFLLGYRTDISRLYNASDIFIMPSIQEGLSVALMEAMGCRKPVIASRIRGNVELVIEDRGGYLVDCFDVDGYAAAIKKFVDNPELAEKFGEYNHEYIRNFDIRVIRNELTEIIENAMNCN